MTPEQVAAAMAAEYARRGTTPGPGEIRFDSEGGLHLPNGWHVPAEAVPAVRKVVRLFTEVARWHDHWGRNLPEDLPREDVVRTLSESAPWTFLDAGNLARIAIACEHVLLRVDRLTPLAERVLRDFALVLEEPARLVRERADAERRRLREERAAARAAGHSRKRVAGRRRDAGVDTAPPSNGQ